MISAFFYPLGLSFKAVLIGQEMRITLKKPAAQKGQLDNFCKGILFAGITKMLSKLA